MRQLINHSRIIGIAGIIPIWPMHKDALHGLKNVGMNKDSGDRVNMTVNK